MKQTTDNQKATACQKAPAENPNMKTDTQTGRAFDIYDKGQHCQELEPEHTRHTSVKWAQRAGEQSGTIASLQGELGHYKAQADKLAEALRGLIAEVKLGKLNVRKDFSLLNHHAYASKCLHQYESEVQHV